MGFPSDTEDLLGWALAYAEQGWPVFPLVPRDKRPLTKRGFLDAKTDRNTVEAWWSFNPEANIGLATGHAFDVLDIDDLDTLGVIWDSLGIDAYRHTGPVSWTGKGGHMLFAPTGKGNGAGLLEHVDYRGMGGYIVAPPSIHPSGRRYTWDTERDPTTPIPAAPEWLTTLLERTREPATEVRPLALVNPFSPFENKITVSAGSRRLNRPDILAVCAAKGIELRRRSHYYVTKCVYHTENTPSLTIYPRDNSFHCYGCGAHGDSIDLQQGTRLY